MRHPSIALGAVCLLGGCAAVGPDYATLNPTLVTSYAEPAQKGPAVEPETRWWEALSDPLINRLISEGLISNLTVAQALERVREAQADAKAIGAEGLPDVDGSISSETTKTSGKSASTSATGELASGWEIDLFGKYRRSREGARATVEAAQEDLSAARLALLGDIATSYVEARGYQNRLSVARRALNGKREAVTVVQAQLQAGGATTLDVSQAVGSAASTEANIPALEASLHASLNRLASLLDLPVATMRTELAKGRAVPLPRQSISAGLPADLLRNRPDIRRAERNLAAVVADIGVREADLYPSLQLSGSITISAERIAGLSTDSGGWALGPSLTVPVFDAGRRKALVDVERSQAREQYLAYRETVASAVEEVENALVSFNRERQRQMALRRSVVAYKQAVTQSIELYKSGAADFLHLLDAQDDLYSAEDKLVQNEAAIATAYITLCEALGGGWAITNPLEQSSTGN
ncbi:efflux transporter outer membrane subunit [Ensifer sp. 4252]|uniref:efflux transporter outer membrane subunit n=1 Tax=Ensifer sp. 4252 TaxID=3373915 RepID=UPI003D260CBF